MGNDFSEGMRASRKERILKEDTRIDYENRIKNNILALQKLDNNIDNKVYESMDTKNIDKMKELYTQILKDIDDMEFVGQRIPRDFKDEYYKVKDKHYFLQRHDANLQRYYKRYGNYDFFGVYYFGSKRTRRVSRKAKRQNKKSRKAPKKVRRVSRKVPKRSKKSKV